MFALGIAALGYGAIGAASYLAKYRTEYAKANAPHVETPGVGDKPAKRDPVAEPIDTSLITGNQSNKAQDRTVDNLVSERDSSPSKASQAERILNGGDKPLAPLPVMVPLNYVKAPRVAVHARNGVGIGGRRQHTEQAGSGFTPVIVGGWLPIQREPSIIATETDSSGNTTQYRSRSSLRNLFGF